MAKRLKPNQPPDGHAGSPGDRFLALPPELQIRVTTFLDRNSVAALNAAYQHQMFDADQHYGTKQELTPFVELIKHFAYNDEPPVDENGLKLLCLIALWSA